jgi:1-acyl-sn-glycerol-3-phosphate acyltransferase
LSIHQPIRILGKHEMVKYPIFGLIYRLAAISVDRTSAEARARSVRALKAALAQHISIFIFPEGTFNETDEPLKSFFDGAFRIAIETGTPIKPLLFLDTHQRMHYRGFFELTPGISRTVYLSDVPVTNYTMAQVKELKEKVYNSMEEGLRRYQKKYKEKRE